MIPIIAPGSQIVPLTRRRSEQPGYSFFRFRSDRLTGAGPHFQPPIKPFQKFRPFQKFGPFQKFPEFQWAHPAIQPMRRFKPGLKLAGCSRLISDAEKKEQAA
jgi:hypothetical protein